MPRKTYGIYGKTSAKLDFVRGQAKVTVNFHGGIPDQRTNKPAIAVTDNTVAQFIIEHDQRFGKLVRLISSYPTAQEKAEAVKAAAAATAAAKKEAGTSARKEETKPAKTDETTEAASAGTAKGTAVHDECRTFNEVREVLMDLGATAKETLSKEACRATAARLNVTFPNWK